MLIEPTPLYSAIALLLGALLGTWSRLYFKPGPTTLDKSAVTELIANGLTAVIIPYLSTIPGVGQYLDVSKLPLIAAFVLMYFIASGSGDFLGNIRRKILGVIPGNEPQRPPLEPPTKP
jgi:peptidoglycan/LPS O-acetylase OafA/YrhL